LEPVAHDPPIPPTPCQSSVIDYRHQMEGFSRRDFPPVFSHMASMQDKTVV
jgi:hypothetical protein